MQDTVYDQFLADVQRIGQGLTQGPPLKACYDCGAMTMPQQVSKVEELVQDAVSKGARVLVGGKRNANYPNAQFFEPTS